VRYAAFVAAAGQGDIKTVEAMLQGDNPVPVDGYRKDCHYKSALFLKRVTKETWQW